jgi:hypothetical protein
MNVQLRDMSDSHLISLLNYLITNSIIDNNTDCMQQPAQRPLSSLKETVIIHRQ